MESNYSLSKHLRPCEVAVHNAELFFGAVRAATKRGEFLVHGVKRHGTKVTANGLMLRRKIGDDATVDEVARRGWAVDVDLKQASPLHAALSAEKVDVFADIKGAAATVARLALPSWLQTGPLLWQASGSCGLADPSLARFHYFCWLDKPLTPGDMKCLMRYHNADLQAEGLSDTPHAPCDTALYQGVQPVYLCATFEGGHDPIATRFGVLASKRPCSRAPAIETVARSIADKPRDVVANGKGGYEPLPLDDISWPGQVDERLALHGFHSRCCT